MSNELERSSKIELKSFFGAGANGLFGPLKVLSGMAHDSNTGVFKHPKDIDPLSCVMVLAVRDRQGNRARLLDPNPSKDHLENWNTGKYGYVSVRGRALQSGEQIPEKFCSIRETYGSVVQNIILVDKIEPVSEQIFKSGQVIIGDKSPALSNDQSQLTLE